MLAAYVSLSIGYTANLEEKVREQTADLRHAQEETICRVASASRWSDNETEMHMRRTAMLSEILAAAAGWFGDELGAIRLAAPLHDVGKIGLPDAILQKPGKLTPDEFEVMKTHTLIGSDILADSKMPMLTMAQEIALNHHERWDGRGYPHGLAGEDIPEMRSHRGHRRCVRCVDARSGVSAREVRSGGFGNSPRRGREPF